MRALTITAWASGIRRAMSQARRDPDRAVETLAALRQRVRDTLSEYVSGTHEITLLDLLAGFAAQEGDREGELRAQAESLARIEYALEDVAVAYTRQTATMACLAFEREDWDEAEALLRKALHASVMLEIIPVTELNEALQRHGAREADDAEAPGIGVGTYGVLRCPGGLPGL